MKSALILSTLTLITAQQQPPCSRECHQVAATESSCSEGKSLSQHATCMCREKPFFKEWTDCRLCLRDDKKEISADEFRAYSSVLDSARAALCGPSPTASFQALFTQASAARNKVPQGVVSSSVPSGVSSVGHSRVDAEAEAGAAAGRYTDGNTYASASGAASAEATGETSAAARAQAEARAGSEGASASAGATAEADGQILSTSTQAGFTAPTDGTRTSSSLSPSSTSLSRGNSTTGLPSVSGASAVTVAGGLVMVVVAAALAI
ncbi:collagen-like protein Mcl1 [Ophiocordyceps camponoti-floridani]|uniref:Collagen-like protein Mcl1 n=1 Tax=Ophiocordyceps camponoti-floridani TaxID=2030778 RepID=A0A8H4Q3D3_9HYPO|nr:collagen-like protein Mcl1 [Ophiocordyceps camponoti-floridani]